MLKRRQKNMKSPDYNFEHSEPRNKHDTCNCSFEYLSRPQRSRYILRSQEQRTENILQCSALLSARRQTDRHADAHLYLLIQFWRLADRETDMIHIPRVLDI